jgi:undecaprenyl-diphosphatase
MGKHFIAFLLVLVSFQALAQNWDYQTLKSINKNRNNSSEGMMELLNNSDYVICGAVPFMQLVTAYASNDVNSWEGAKQSLIGYGYDLAFTELFKYSLQRDRPATTYPTVIKAYRSNTDPSLPSGHTSMIFSAATSISISHPKWYVIAPSYFLAGAVGYSQLYLGMHYPTDVLLGAVVGAGSSWLSYKTNQWINKRRNAKMFMQY